MAQGKGGTSTFWSGSPPAVFFACAQRRCARVPGQPSAFFDGQMDVGYNPHAGWRDCDRPSEPQLQRGGTVEHTHAFSPKAVSWVG